MKTVCFPSIYKCRKCRSVLFHEGNIIPHSLGQMVSWKDLKCAKEANNCKQGLFIEPLNWMMDKVLTTMSDRLHCSKCSNKLGHYSWEGNASCSCGSLSSPGFWINFSRIDRCFMRKEIEAKI